MKVTIMRGIPGSGKSTYAKALNPEVICSADLFFMVSGEYNFDPSLISEAHKTCLRQFLHSLNRRAKDIVVDNTNIHAWEISPYYNVAEAHCYEVEIVNVHFDAPTAHNRCIHGVPFDVIYRMKRDMLNEKLPPWWKQKNL